MAFSVDFDSELDIVRVRFSGAITSGDLRGSSERGIALQKARGTRRYLVESEDWNLEVSLVDIHDLPDRVYGEAAMDRATRIAVVQPGNERALQGARFYEDACRNRGWNARLLPDRESAIDWLKGA